MSGSETALPMLRTFSGSFDDHTKINDDITLRYGVTMDNVVFLDRLNYLSPYARLTYTIWGTVRRTRRHFHLRQCPPRTRRRAPGDNGDLQQDLNALGLFPRISVLNSRTASAARWQGYEV